MTQRGNILFLILLAVVLFAAMSYAVTGGMRGGGNNANKESVQAGASAVQNYVTLLRNEVGRLMLVNGCTLDNLDWRHSYKRYNTQSTSMSSSVSSLQATLPKTGCTVFKEYGGSVEAQTFDRYRHTEYHAYAHPGGWQAGHGAIRFVTRLQEGTEQADMAILFNGLDPDICLYLNNPSKPATAMFGDGFSTEDPHETPPNWTSSGDTVSAAANLNTDFFLGMDTLPNGLAFCTLGAILISR